MRWQWRLAVGVAVALTLTGCGSDRSGGPASSVSPTGSGAPSATYVVAAGDSVYGIAERAGVAPTDLVSANGWDGVDHLIVPGDVVILPTGATAVIPRQTTAPAVASPTLATSPTGTANADYTLVGFEGTAYAGPDFGGVTHELDAALPDGYYWSWSHRSDGTAVTFDLDQVFLGDACRERFGADDEEACASDVGTIDTPVLTITAVGADFAATVIDDPDEDSGYQMSAYRVAGAEYVSLLAGNPPSSGAPATFKFQSAPVVLTVRGGRVTAVDQHWMS